MSGLRIIVTARGFKQAAERFRRLGEFDRGDLLDQVGAMVESQTRRRIASEKTSPEGKAWPANLEGGSILMRGGGLLDSIAFQVSGDSVEIGSGLVYAAIHQFGGTIRAKRANRLAFSIGGKSVFAKQVTIPPRPYLGISAQNADEIEDLSLTVLGSLLQ